MVHGGPPPGRGRSPSTGFPDDLPPEAAAEREYVTRIGLRSQLTIPLRVGGAGVGAIGFASFGREVHWSPRLVRSVRLIE